VIGTHITVLDATKVIDPESAVLGTIGDAGVVTRVVVVWTVTFGGGGGGKGGGGKGGGKGGGGGVDELEDPVKSLRN
jgi:hypothetical protein